MSYAAASDLRQRFGTAEIALLDGAGDDRVTAALSDASAEIDAEIAAVYDLPLPAGPWPLLTIIAADLARARLFDDEVPRAVRSRTAQSRRLLQTIARGCLALVDARGIPAPRQPMVRTAGDAPALRREDLRDAAV